MKRIAIVTDAWHPQINGVVTTLAQTVKYLENSGYLVRVFAPEMFKSIPCPTYPEIRLSLVWPGAIKKHLLAFKPDSIHIATEGPLGWAARRVCRKHKLPFTTSYHTRYPEYVRERFPIPLSLLYAVIKAFHRPAARTMVATRALEEELSGRGFSNLAFWSRGVDSELFRAGSKDYLQVEGPVFMYTGRVSVEKNLRAFLDLELPGTKVVVGDGPEKENLVNSYPDVMFTGYRHGKELALTMDSADVFVFPSLTDTFGVVLLEAMACGVPVAAYPVTGPMETVRNGINGYLDSDLRTAALKALDISPQQCRNFALKYSWGVCGRQFLDNLVFS